MNYTYGLIPQSMEQIRYLIDANDTRIAVVIPMKDWELILKYYKDFEYLKRVFEGINQGLQDVADIKAGRVKPMTMEELLANLEEE